MSVDLVAGKLASNRREKHVLPFVAGYPVLAHHSFAPSLHLRDAISVVRLLIERQGLAQRDLIPQFGSESAPSMFLAGQRKLTLEQVRKLSSRFKLPADVFIRSLC
jgi:antitoxin component HigA of HigAB toxin-antitoxin module